MDVGYPASLGVTLEMFRMDLRVRQVQILSQVLCMWMTHIQAALFWCFCFTCSLHFTSCPHVCLMLDNKRYFLVLWMIIPAFNHTQALRSKMFEWESCITLLLLCTEVYQQKDIFCFHTMKVSQPFLGTNGCATGWTAWSCIKLSNMVLLLFIGLLLQKGYMLLTLASVKEEEL